MDTDAQGAGPHSPTENAGVRGPTDATPGGWLTLREAADVAGVHPGTVRRWAKAGKVASERVVGKFGEQLVVRREDLHRANLVRQARPDTPAGSPAPVVAAGDLAALLDRLAEAEAARREAEVRAAAAEARLEWLDALPRELEASRAERDDLLRQVARLEAEAHQAREAAQEPPRRRRWWSRRHPEGEPAYANGYALFRDAASGITQRDHAGVITLSECIERAKPPRLQPGRGTGSYCWGRRACTDLPSQGGATAASSETCR